MDQDNTIADCGARSFGQRKICAPSIGSFRKSGAEDIHDLAAAMAATRQEMSGVQADIREIKQSVSKLTARPGIWSGTSWLRRPSAQRQQELWRQFWPRML